MDPLTLGLLFGGGGLLKSELFDRPRANQERATQAEIMRWSPWTGMKGKEVAPVDQFGTAVSSGLQGASFAQALQRDEAMKNLIGKGKANVNYNVGGGAPASPWRLMDSNMYNGQGGYNFGG